MRFPGPQCDYKFCTGNQNFTTGRQRATIIIQTVTLIFSQTDSSKIHSHTPIGHLLFTFPLLLKYKADFPVIINLPKRFTTTISAKLCCHDFSAVSYNSQITNGSGDWNEKCCTVVAWCKQYSDLLIILTERERKDRLERIWQSHKTAYMSSI